MAKVYEFNVNLKAQFVDYDNVIPEEELYRRLKAAASDFFMSDDLLGDEAGDTDINKISKRIEIKVVEDDE